MNKHTIENIKKHMNKEWTGQWVLFPVVYLLWYLLYPERMACVEADSFFAWTPDYMAARRGEPIGWLADFLSQFYRWREVAALLQALTTWLLLLALQYVACRFRLRGALWVAMALACGFAVWQLQEISLVRSLRCLTGVALLAGCVAWLPLARWLPERKGKQPGDRLSRCLSLVCLCTLSFLFVTNAAAQKEEKEAAVEHAAMLEDWDRILRLVSPETATSNPRLMRYLLLALNEKGEMPNHLPKLSELSDLSLSGPDCFYFYRGTHPYARYFNSLFYASLGLYNESVHQLFEMAVQSEHGISFRCLRHLVDWYLKMGNVPLAEKYLTLLDHSTCHTSWVARRRLLLNALQEKPIQTPVRSPRDLFIGAYTFLPEMAALLQEDPLNRKKTDYYLCALLLANEKEAFATALRTLPYYRQEGGRVPKGYGTVNN